MSKEKKEPLKCIWELGDPCNGETKEVPLFKKQLGIPICEHHLNGHRVIMMLCGNGYQIEEIVDMEDEERKRLAYTLQLSGIELDKFEI